MKCEELWQIFKKNDFTFFSGVPDSTFKHWMKFLDDEHGDGLINRIAAIERDAVGWAAGYHAATGKVGVVYMQNSGLGNTVNPITSLVDPDVYNIPILLLVGWRGEPGVKDEPQHVKMGKVTLPLLETLGIKYKLLPSDVSEAGEAVSEAKEYISRTGGVFALVIKKGTIDEYEKRNVPEENLEMKREDAIKIISDVLDSEDVVVSTTGKTSRELFEYREEKSFGHQNDFLMVGSMGLASSFAAEIALQKVGKNVFIFDGDGAAIMNMGSLSTIGCYSPKNLHHIVFDNSSYESTGGQPTTSTCIALDKIALANGYKGARIVSTSEELLKVVGELKELEGPQMLIVKVKKGSRKDLGRPTTTPIENKEAFMGFLNN